MPPVPSELRAYSTRRLLIWRVRLTMLICVAGGVIFGGKELLLTHAASPQLWTQVLGTSMAATTFWVLGRRCVLRWAWPVSTFVVSVAYVMTAIAGILSPTGEYWTTVVFFVGAAMTTATIVPWGLWGQLITVVVGTISLGVAVFIADGNLAVIITDAGAATVIALALSVVTAGEVNRYRVGHRSELLRRRRGELAFKHLNTRLEQRVAERTAQLQVVNEELRRHQDELAHVLRLHTIAVMAAGLAHEINQPLGAITNYAQGAVQRLRTGTVSEDELREVLQHITDEGLRAGKIIRGIRTLVQRTTPPGESVDVNALAVEAVRLLESRARRHGVTVRLERATELPRVWADGMQIEQVMLNLMLNGVEAIEETANGRRELVVATGSSAGGVEVGVSDTGVGLSPVVAAKLFTPFLTTKQGGLGLGLAISRSIVELHGGRLWVTRNPIAGMTFRFWLPGTSAEQQVAAS